MKIITLLATLILSMGVGSSAHAKEVVTGSVAIEPTSDLTYGGHVDIISTTTGRLSPGSSVYVTVVCAQDGHIVYQNSGDPTSVFLLADQVGDGLNWDGDAADCEATLIYRQRSGKNFSYTFLDTETFAVSANKL